MDPDPKGFESTDVTPLEQSKSAASSVLPVGGRSLENEDWALELPTGSPLVNPPAAAKGFAQASVKVLRAAERILLRTEGPGWLLV